MSAVRALACACAVTVVWRDAEALDMEPPPPPVEAPSPAPGTAAPQGAAGAIPDASPSPPAPATAAAPGAVAPQGIEITYEERRKITWYSPDFDPWSMVDFRIYPSIGRSDLGERKMMLVIVVKDPSKGRPTSLQVATEGDPWIVPISESEEINTQNSGCRETQTIYLQNQAPIVQMLAGTARAEATLVGYRHAVHYKMTPEDLEGFKRIAALWSNPVLPPAPSKQMTSPPLDALVAGAGRVTNPEVIPGSKVRPRFPRFAEGKKVLGRVVLQAIIRKDGTVGDIQVLRSAGGDCGFEEAAITAVRKWRYKPGMMDGKPVDVYFTVIIDFAYGPYRMAPG